MSNEPSGDKRLPVDEEARLLARQLVRTARSGCLATLSPQTGAPMASLVAMASDLSGHPLLLVSNLAAHTAALGADPRCSLLILDERISPDATDGPLASSRIMLVGKADILERGSELHDGARSRFLARHPASAAYADFADFHFFRVRVQAATLIGGFARAYVLTAPDVVDEPLTEDLAAAIERARRHMNADHGDAIDAMARQRGVETSGLQIATGDAGGFEIAVGDRLLRIEFTQRVETPAELRGAYVTLAKSTA